MKFLIEENGRKPKKPTPTPFRPPRNTHGMTKSGTRYPRGGRQATARLRCGAATYHIEYCIFPRNNVRVLSTLFKLRVIYFCCVSN